MRGVLPAHQRPQRCWREVQLGGQSPGDASGEARACEVLLEVRFLLLWVAAVCGECWTEGPREPLECGGSFFFIALRRSFCLDSRYPQADPRCPVICHRVAYCHFPPCLCERSIGVIKALKELSSKSSGFLNNFIKCCDALE